MEFAWNIVLASTVGYCVRAACITLLRKLVQQPLTYIAKLNGYSPWVFRLRRRTWMWISQNSNTCGWKIKREISASGNHHLLFSFLRSVQQPVATLFAISRVLYSFAMYLYVVVGPFPRVMPSWYHPDLMILNMTTFSCCSKL